MRLILQNANLTHTQTPANLAINALTGELVNLEEAGIIDPALVVTEVITNGTSAANMVLLSEVTVHDNQAKYDPREDESYS
jgi:chaperonin GroEL (HSP60 family)